MCMGVFVWMCVCTYEVFFFAFVCLFVCVSVCVRVMCVFSNVCV